MSRLLSRERVQREREREKQLSVECEMRVLYSALRYIQHPFVSLPSPVTLDLQYTPMNTWRSGFHLQLQRLEITADLKF